MNLFDVTKSIDPFNPGMRDRRTRNDGPRDCTERELRAYLNWLAERDGIAVPAGAKYGPDGITAGGAVIVPMPGYGVPQIVTCEIEDDAGNVVRSFPLPADKSGKLPMTAKQVQEWSGLAPKRKARAKAAPKVPSAPIPAQMAPEAISADAAARIAELEAQVAALSVALEAAQHVAETQAAIAADHMRMRETVQAELQRMAREGATVQNPDARQGKPVGAIVGVCDAAGAHPSTAADANCIPAGATVEMPMPTGEIAGQHSIAQNYGSIGYHQKNVIRLPARPILGKKKGPQECSPTAQVSIFCHTAYIDADAPRQARRLRTARLHPKSRDSHAEGDCVSCRPLGRMVKPGTRGIMVIAQWKSESGIARPSRRGCREKPAINGCPRIPLGQVAADGSG